MAAPRKTKYPVPLEVLEGDIAILGKKGRGKTYTAKGIVERLLDSKRRVVVLDPLSTWWGLKTTANGKSDAYPVAVFGGPHGDIPINDGMGKALGKIISHDNVPCVIDLGQMRKAEMNRLATDLLETMYLENRDPITVVLEEADVFAPQNPMHDSTRLFHEVDRIARRGRAFGFRLITLCQRPARLNKDVLTQLSTLIALGVTSPQDRDAIQKWVEGNADRDQAKEVVSTLAGLGVGEGWVWAPDHDVLKRVRFPKIRTLDTSATPKEGEKRVEPKKLAQIDVGPLLDALKAAETAIDDEAALAKPKARKRASQAPVAAPGHELSRQSRAHMEEPEDDIEADTPLVELDTSDEAASPHESAKPTPAPIQATPAVASLTDGRRGSLKDKIAAFVEAAMKSPDKIGQLWFNEALGHRIDGRTAPTVQLYQSKYRAAMKAIGLEKSAWGAVTLNAETLERIENELSKKKTPKKANAESAAPVDQRVEAFIKRVSGYKHMGHVALAWRNELRHNQHLSPTSLATYVSKYRTAVSKKFGADSRILDYVKAPSAKARNAEKLEAAEQRKPPSTTPGANIPAFVKDIAGMSKTAIAAAWITELDVYSERTPGTRKLYVSRYRTAILAEYGPKHPAMDVVRLPDSESAAIRAQYDASVVHENKNLVLIQHWERIVDRAMSMLDGDPFQQANALMLLTGRRTHEVFVTGKLTLGKSPWRSRTGLFTGQAKTRGAEGTMADTVFPIPLLGKASDIVEAWNSLRASGKGREWSHFTNRDVNNRLTRPGNATAVREFSAYWPNDAELTMARLRALYAEIAYMKYGQKKPISKPAFFAQILGHKPDDLRTSLSYFDYYLQAGTKRTAKGILTKTIKAHREQQSEFMSEDG